jgi:1-deoxy-D-xylulose-5-phosphate synthase
MLFEEMGITYIGPIDGHNIGEVEYALRVAKKTDFPVLIHTVTSKGKGYSFAETDPCKFHGIGAFDVETGEVLKNGSAPKTFTGEFSELLIKHAEKDERIVAVTAAMETGTGLQAFNELYPKRFFEVGIAEEHAVALAAGLAIGGKLPVVAIYSTFLQRAYDEIVTNVALPNLNVVFCIDRAGIVGADGATHHGLLDIAYLRSIPNMKILAPSSTDELASAFEFALSLAPDSGPIAIRYPKAQFKFADESCSGHDLESWASGNALKEEGNSTKITIFAVGKMVALAKAARSILREDGIDVNIYNARWLKPISASSARVALEADILISLEDGTTSGGFGSGLLEKMSEIFACADSQSADSPHNKFPKFKLLGVPDTFVSHGDESDLFESLNLSPEGLAQTIKGLL